MGTSSKCPQTESRLWRLTRRMRPEIPGTMASGTWLRGEPSSGAWRSRVQDPVSRDAVEGSRRARAGRDPCDMGSPGPGFAWGKSYVPILAGERRRKRGARS